MLGSTLVLVLVFARVGGVDTNCISLNLSLTPLLRSGCDIAAIAWVDGLMDGLMS